MKVVSLVIAMFLVSACASTIERRNPTGKVFPDVKATGLDEKEWHFPKDLAGKKTLLLIGYDQDAQFDIDRWLIGLEMVGSTATVFEVPTINGWIPSLIANKIDEGMRSGIPQGLWKAVVTVYDDADKILQFTGNQDPLNARAVVLDEAGKVVYFHDRGFSPKHLTDVSAFFGKNPAKVKAYCP